MGGGVVSGVVVDAVVVDGAGGATVDGTGGTAEVVVEVVGAAVVAAGSALIAARGLIVGDAEETATLANSTWWAGEEAR